MVNQLIAFYKQNKRNMLVGGIIGAGLFFLSNRFLPEQASVLQSGLSVQGLADKIGITPDIKALLFFIIIGIALNVLISRIIKKK